MSSIIAVTILINSINDPAKGRAIDIYNTLYFLFMTSMDPYHIWTTHLCLLSILLNKSHTYGTTDFFFQFDTQVKSILEREVDSSI